ncbi:MAG: Tripartite ATP-independent periplasmic transporter DctQ component [Proteobacteria bacterium]|nr:Tripartite ATP-independent periplasmic transporter DctQ component [Pseudomonadota bacterium]
MNILFSLKRPVDRLLETALVLLFFTLFACVIIGVFTRYVLNDPAIFTEEASRFSIIWLSLLGTAYACGRLEHMAYTMLPEKLHGEKLLAHMRSVALIVLFFGSTVMLYGGGKLAMRTFQYEQLSATLALPMGYVYLCIPISGALVVFYQILILLKPSNFQTVDEVQAALDHLAEEERKLAHENEALYKAEIDATEVDSAKGK